jgi:hypothetical protein
MFPPTQPDEHHDHINRLAAPRTHVRSTFSNCQGTLVNEDAYADDARRLVARVIGLAFEFLRSSDHGTLRVTVTSSHNDSPFVAEITNLPSIPLREKG